MDSDRETVSYNICMVSDFFFPNTGGIEEHIYQLSQCLLERGHKIVVVTHSYGDRKGVRWMTNGLKVYYVPAQVFYNGSILPTLITLLPVLRQILIREEIQIVHGHGAFSSLAHDTLFASKLLNLKGIFTDHSLFGFADASAILTNRFLEISLADITNCICVSHTGKANTVLRAKAKANQVYVIPNAVDANYFKPLQLGEKGPPDDRIIVIILSRLVYRKGVDLLSGIIPAILEQHNNVDFYIGGDGPKRLQLEEIREIYGDRVQLFGSLDHSQVRDFLVQGHIFLNTSLTEAYCMAIVEAACSGLQVVSTNVGGIPEVLPPEFLFLTDPEVPALVQALSDAIFCRESGDFVDPTKMHRTIARIYNWRDVACRTEIVYHKSMAEDNPKNIVRMRKYLNVGFLVGPLFVLVFSLGHLIMRIQEYLLPAKSIGRARNPNRRQRVR